ncbi:MAG TPA: chemotaxis protein CheW [Polyangiaceae bacterium]|nr:chemotaxis protein CheW [Polyangiaceae bacterium]
MIVPTNQYVSFRLAAETYAIDVSHAKEIVEAPRITALPHSPPWIRGVMNLRGSVVPVVDLKSKFAMGTTELTAHTCALLVEFEAEEGRFLIAVLVDAVLAVFELLANELESAPAFGARYSRKYLKGVGRREGVLFMVLDANEVFADVEPELGDAPAENDEREPAPPLSGPRPEDAPSL